MGRKTFDSVGKPLPSCTRVIVTRNRDLQLEGCLIAHSLEEAITLCGNAEEIFGGGGADLYTLVLPKVDTLYVTEIL